MDMHWVCIKYALDMHRYAETYWHIYSRWACFAQLITGIFKKEYQTTTFPEFLLKKMENKHNHREAVFSSFYLNGYTESKVRTTSDSILHSTAGRKKTVSQT